MSKSSKTATMSVINVEANVIVLINVFTVDPDRQQELIDLLVDATEKVMKYRTGFISANIHVGLDGTTVANYVQWESEANFQEMLADPIAQHHLHAVCAIATTEPHLYRVASTHTAYPDRTAQATRTGSRAL